MKKIAAGFLIATSLVALAGCKKPKKPDAVNATAPVETVAGNNMSAAMTNASDNASNAMTNASGNASNGMTQADNKASTTPFGSNGGH